MIYFVYIYVYIYIYITHILYYIYHLLHISHMHAKHSPQPFFSPLTYTNSFPIKKISLEPPQSPQVEFRDAKSKANPSQATSWTTAWICYICYTLCELDTVYIFTQLYIYICITSASF